MTRTEQFSQSLNHVSNRDTADITAFLAKDLHRPLIATGSGGSFSACRYASLLYNAAGGFARAETPYSVNSISDKTFSQSKLLVVSSSGKNADAQYILSRGEKLIPKYTLQVSDQPRAEGAAGHGFVCSSIDNLAIIYKSFVGHLHPEEFDTERSFSYRYNGKNDTPPSLADIRHFVVLHGSWGEPAAVDLESRFVESGMASVQISDYRNFCHGRFLFVSNHIGAKGTPADTALVLLVTPREKNIAAKLLSFMPADVPVIMLESEKDSPIATIELIMQGIRLFDAAGEAHGIDPCNPSSCGGIDKRHPQSRLTFKTDFKEFGALEFNKLI